jgi:hypothetical protein
MTKHFDGIGSLRFNYETVTSDNLRELAKILRDDKNIHEYFAGSMRIFSRGPKLKEPTEIRLEFDYQIPNNGPGADSSSSHDRYLRSQIRGIVEETLGGIGKWHHGQTYPIELV